MDLSHQWTLSHQSCPGCQGYLVAPAGAPASGNLPDLIGGDPPAGDEEPAPDDVSDESEPGDVSDESEPGDVSDESEPEEEDDYEHQYFRNSGGDDEESGNDDAGAEEADDEAVDETI